MVKGQTSTIRCYRYHFDTDTSRSSTSVNSPKLRRVPLRILDAPQYTPPQGSIEPTLFRIIHLVHVDPLVRPAATGDVGAADRVHLAADLADREPVPGRRHRRQAPPAVGLGGERLVRAIGADQVVEVGLAAQHGHAPVVH